MVQKSTKIGRSHTEEAYDEPANCHDRRTAGINSIAEKPMTCQHLSSQARQSHNSLRCDPSDDALPKISGTDLGADLFGRTMMENEAPKLCSKVHSLLNSCVYPSSARRPSSLALTDRESGVDIVGAPSSSHPCLFILRRRAYVGERQ